MNDRDFEYAFDNMIIQEGGYINDREDAGFYRLLAAVNPSKEKFLSGWLNRAYA
jgi:hypothetical protein